MASDNQNEAFQILPNRDYILVHLRGRLGNESARRFTDEFPQLLPTPAADVILDFENVEDLTQSWVRCWVQLLQQLKVSNNQIRLISVNEAMMKILKQEGVDSSLKCLGNLQEALADLKPAQGKVLLDVNFVNPFLIATMKVLEVQASTKAVAGKIYARDSREKFQGDISGVIGLVSEAFTGSVVISFPQATFLKIISRMLGEEFTEITKDIEDGAGEMTNMIFGQAKVSLNEKGYGIKTALPSVVSGAGHSVLQVGSGPRLVIPFESDAGSFFVEVCVSTN